MDRLSYILYIICLYIICLFAIFGGIKNNYESVPMYKVTIFKHNGAEYTNFITEEDNIVYGSTYFRTRNNSIYTTLPFIVEKIDNKVDDRR